MMADNIQNCFPEGVLLPRPICVICDYWEKFGYTISGCFEFWTEPDVIAAWFPGDERMQKQFAVFAQTSTGGAYALWLTHCSDSNHAPIVVLGSEGDNRVLAATPLEFCKLLGCGYEELEWDDLSDAPEPENVQETERLRNWFQKKLNIECPTTGEEIQKQAETKYPGLEELVRKWYDDNDL